ncbi:DUF6119 family protein [Bradyrhizobium liaoningense]|uniref:DUF6119 family protein n=1 Tax=Bradyrhizobium liaoningense TaxID=43992 RepID=UPI003D9BB9C4
MPNLKSFSLYLAKAEVKAFDVHLTDTARDMVRAGTVKSHASSRFGDGAILYVFPGQQQTPKWIPLLRSAFANLENHFVRSPCALLTFRKEIRAVPCRVAMEWAPHRLAISALGLGIEYAGLPTWKASCASGQASVGMLP